MSSKKRKVYKVIRLYKVNIRKRVNIAGSLAVAMKDLTPLAFWIYCLLLFANKEFEPSNKNISRLLGTTTNLTKVFIDELVVKGYVAIRSVKNEIHFIVYYDNLDSIINGSYRNKPEYERFTYQRNYDQAQKKALQALERRKKKLEEERGKVDE